MDYYSEESGSNRYRGRPRAGDAIILGQNFEELC